MPIPDYQRIMLPLLEFAADKKEHSILEVIEHISKRFKLNEEEKRKLLPSGQQAIIDNRAGWARTYLMKAGLLESGRRGYTKITDEGLAVLKENPAEINRKYLERFQEFREFITPKRDEKEILQQDVQQTPQESLEYAYQRIQHDLAQELLNPVKKCSPKFFEKLVVDLLLKMGYGGSRKYIQNAAKVTGKSGDEGIDGIINEDKLGLDVIYIQAKRWEGTVGRPEIQKFVGALQGHGAKKGIFITTAKFSDEAKDYVSRIDTKIVLIDEEQLAQLMIDYDIGVSKLNTYEIKKIDSDYFSEE